MRYLAIDYGLKRLGLAICDAQETIFSPLCQLESRSGQRDRLLKEIGKIAKEYEAGAIVVGLPLNMDGSEGEQARLCRQFAEQVGQALSLPVHLQDERLSSAAADEMLAESGLTSGKRKSRRDMLAACDILRDFLDRR